MKPTNRGNAATKTRLFKIRGEFKTLGVDLSGMTLEFLHIDSRLESVMLRQPRIDNAGRRSPSYPNGTASMMMTSIDEVDNEGKIIESGEDLLASVRENKAYIANQQAGLPEIPAAEPVILSWHNPETQESGCTGIKTYQEAEEMIRQARKAGHLGSATGFQIVPEHLHNPDNGLSGYILRETNPQN